MIVNKYSKGGGSAAGVSSIDGQTGALTTKTINGNAILGSGDIVISGGSGDADAVILDYNSGTSLDTLFSEIKDAYSGGKKVYLRGLSNYNEDTVLGLIMADPSLESFSFTGTGVKGSDTSSIRTFAVSIWKHEGGSAGINGVQSGKFVPETIISNYQLLPASASWLGGVKVGSGLSIDENGVLSTSGSSGPVVYNFIDWVAASAEEKIAMRAEWTADFNSGKTVYMKAETTGSEIIYLLLEKLEYYDQFRYASDAYLCHLSINNSSAMGAQGKKVKKVDIITKDNKASAYQLGVVKVGSGLTIDGNGVLSVSGGSSSGPAIYYFNQMSQAELTALYTELVAYKDQDGYVVSGFPAANYTFLIYHNGNDFSGYVPLNLCGFSQDAGGSAIFSGSFEDIWWDLQRIYRFNIQITYDGTVVDNGAQLITVELNMEACGPALEDGLYFDKATSAFTDGNESTYATGTAYEGKFKDALLSCAEGNWGFYRFAYLAFRVSETDGSYNWYSFPHLIKKTLASSVTIDSVEFSTQMTLYYGPVSLRFYVNGSTIANLEFIEN